MKYLIVLTLTALILSVGGRKKDVEQSPAGNGKSPISNPEQASVDVAKEHELEVRAVHSTVPEEMVRVHLYLYRGDQEEPWLDFYQCRPATKTTRASSTALDRVAVMDTGVTTTLCHYNFGGDTSEVQVPLTEFDMQWVAVELGWKSSLDLTQ